MLVHEFQLKEVDVALTSSVKYPTTLSARCRHTTKFWHAMRSPAVRTNCLSSSSAALRPTDASSTR